jgi:hypothetical protein
MARDYTTDPQANDHLTSRDPFAHVSYIVVTAVYPQAVHVSTGHSDPACNPSALRMSREQYAATASKMDLYTAPVSE